jgi:Tfp pilus assembly protein PilP
VRRFGLIVLLLAVASPGVAEEPAKPAGPVKDGVATPPAPNLGGVKDVVKDAVKDAIPKLPTAAPAKPALPAAAPAAAAPTDPAAIAAARLQLLRRKTLRDDDFMENEERNRDPFRSYLRLFTAKEGPRTPKVPAIFDKFALEELTLIGIVSGDAIPRAMFRDPGGLGQTIKRGDYISKAAARVTKILSDRVILELNEVTATGETRALERPILVNPEGAQK